MWGIAIDESVSLGELEQLRCKGSFGRVRETVVQLPDGWTEDQCMYVPSEDRQLKVYPQNSLMAKAYIGAKYGERGLEILARCIASNTPITDEVPSKEQRHGEFEEPLEGSCAEVALASIAEEKLEGAGFRAESASSKESGKPVQRRGRKIVFGVLASVVAVAAAAIAFYLANPVEPPVLVGMLPQEARVEISDISPNWKVEFYDEGMNPIDESFINRYGTRYRVSGYAKDGGASASRLDENVLPLKIAIDGAIVARETDLLQSAIEEEVQACTTPTSEEEEAECVKVETLCEDSLITFQYRENFAAMGDDNWGVDWERYEEIVCPARKKRAQELANEYKRDVLAVYYTKDGFPMGVFLGEYRGLVEAEHQRARLKRDELDRITTAKAQSLSKKLLKIYAKYWKEEGKWHLEWKTGASGTSINFRSNGEDKYTFFAEVTTPMQFEAAIEEFEGIADNIARLTRLPVKMGFYTNSLKCVKTVKVDPPSTFVIE